MTTMTKSSHITLDETEAIHLDVTDELLNQAKIMAYNIGQSVIDPDSGKTVPVNPKKFPQKAVDIIFPSKELLIEVFLDTNTRKWDSRFKYNGQICRLSPDQMGQFFNTSFYGRLMNKLQKEWPLTDEMYGNLFEGITNKEMALEDTTKLTEDVGEESSEEKEKPTHTAGGRKIMNFGDIGVRGKTAKYFCWPEKGKEFRWSQWKDWKKISPLVRLRFEYSNGHTYGISLSTIGEDYHNRGFRSYDLTEKPILQWLTKEENEDIMTLSAVNKFINYCVKRISKYVAMDPEEVMANINNPDQLTIDEIKTTQLKIKKTLNEIIKKRQPDTFKWN